MSTEPRTVHVNVLVTKSLAVDEPAWCVDPHQGAQFLPDIAHNGAEVCARVEGRHGTVTYLGAWITQAPYAELAPEPLPMVAVEVSSNAVVMAPDAVRSFTALTRAHLDVLDRLADECERLRGEAE
ncbi:DUF6907 domain-containing protein [Streptomyces chartreusis]